MNEHRGRLGVNMASMSALSLYRNAVQFGLSIAMTAFIGPAEYGLVTFTIPIVALVTMLTDFGLSAAITRAPSLSHKEAGAAFSAMVAVGIVLAALLACAAFPLGRAIHMAGLGPILAGMAAVILLTVTATTPRALLERQLHYRQIASVEATAVMLAAAVGLACARYGLGAWSLVIYNFVNHAIRAIAFLWLARRAFLVNFEWILVKPLASFGGWVLATNILNFLARNSDNLLIGAWLGAAAVGVYGLSYQFMLAPLMAITWPTSGILLATLRRNALGESEALRMIEAVMGATAMITVPGMAFLAIGMALPAHMLLSPRWAEVPDLVRWLGPLGALQSIASYNGAILLVAGRARLQFLFTSLNTVVLIATFLLALPFGLIAVTHAYVLSSTLLNLGFVGVIVAFTRLTWGQLARNLSPSLLATAAGFGSVAILTGFTQASWASWIAMTCVYAAAVLVVYICFRGRLATSLRVLVKQGAA